MLNVEENALFERTVEQFELAKSILTGNGMQEIDGGYDIETFSRRLHAACNDAYYDNETVETVCNRQLVRAIWTAFGDFDAHGFIEKHKILQHNTNVLSIQADEKFMKSTKLSDLYKWVMSRENRIGLPQIFVKFGNEWIKGKIGYSNLGYNFRGQISTDLNPKIERNMTLFEMIYD